MKTNQITLVQRLVLLFLATTMSVADGIKFIMSLGSVSPAYPCALELCVAGPIVGDCHPSRAFA